MRVPDPEVRLVTSLADGYSDELVPGSRVVLIPVALERQ
jgi:hypothetical protein